MEFKELVNEDDIRLLMQEFVGFHDSCIPDKFKGEKPYKGESGKDAAKRVLKERGEYDPKDTGPRSDFNRLKKYFDTHFE